MQKMMIVLATCLGLVVQLCTTGCDFGSGKGSQTGTHIVAQKNLFGGSFDANFDANANILIEGLSRNPVTGEVTIAKLVAEQRPDVTNLTIPAITNANSAFNSANWQGLTTYNDSVGRNINMVADTLMTKGLPYLGQWIGANSQVQMAKINRPGLVENLAQLIALAKAGVAPVDPVATLKAVQQTDPSLLAEVSQKYPDILPSSTKSLTVSVPVSTSQPAPNAQPCVMPASLQAQMTSMLAPLAQGRVSFSEPAVKVSMVEDPAVPGAYIVEFNLTPGQVGVPGSSCDGFCLNGFVTASASCDVSVSE